MPAHRWRGAVPRVCYVAGLCPAPQAKTVCIVARVVLGCGAQPRNVADTGHSPAPSASALITHNSQLITHNSTVSDYLALSQSLADLCRRTAGFIRQEAATFDQSRVEHKGLHDLVSYVDQETERRLVAGLRELLPAAGFITEEGTAGAETRAEHTWIIDPLDGTTNFVHGLPC